MRFFWLSGLFVLGSGMGIVVILFSESVNKINVVSRKNMMLIRGMILMWVFCDDEMGKRLFIGVGVYF